MSITIAVSLGFAYVFGIITGAALIIALALYNSWHERKEDNV